MIYESENVPVFLGQYVRTFFGIMRQEVDIHEIQSRVIGLLPNVLYSIVFRSNLKYLKKREISTTATRRQIFYV
jgi:hypothetical protein